MEEAAAAAGLNPLLVELLKIRTSQINGCAFYLRTHTRAALKKGENPDRIAVLPAGKRPTTSPRPTAPPSRSDRDGGAVGVISWPRRWA
ncbi:carboxymuconolactone decarboxylase family protein [Microbispora oryzae]|uniref:carboxymuconolactone decarboxylase family protein n=1 Tax=Microbispora oryzae TaxID=2806554 RepID=UPI0035568249